MPDRSTIVRGALGVALLLVALAAVVPAAASALPVESSTVEIKTDRHMRTVLGREGVKLSGVGALNKGVMIGLSGKEGDLDQTYGSGDLPLAGSLRFKAGKRKLLVSDLVLDTAKRQLRGRVGKRKNFVLAKVVSPLPVPNAFGIEVGVSALPLSAKAAKLLNDRFALERPLRAGWSLGKAQVSAEFYGVPIAGGTLNFAFDEGFRQKLEDLEVSAAVFATGAQTGALPLAFSWPVEPSLTNAGLTRGWVGSEGGIAFTQSEGEPGEEGAQRMVRLWGFRLDFERNTAAALVEARGGDGSFLASFGPPVAQIDVPAATRFDETAKTLSMAPTVATLDAAAAAALNQDFAVGKATQFMPGEPFGTYSFSAALR